MCVCVCVSCCFSFVFGCFLFCVGGDGFCCLVWFLSLLFFHLKTACFSLFTRKVEVVFELKKETRFVMQPLFGIAGRRQLFCQDSVSPCRGFLNVRKLISPLATCLRSSSHPTEALPCRYHCVQHPEMRESEDSNPPTSRFRVRYQTCYILALKFCLLSSPLPYPPPPTDAMQINQRN